MAGAAQSIGWILQVDDKISGVLDKISLKAVEVGKAIADSVKVDLTPAFEQIHARFSDMGSEMQGGFEGTNQVLGDIRDTIIDLSGFMREFLSVETVESMIDMLRPLFAEVKDVIERAAPVIKDAKEAVAQAGVFGEGPLAKFNQWVLNVGFTLKTLEITVWRPIKWVIGLPFRLASRMIKSVFTLLKIAPVVVKGIAAAITVSTGGLLKILSIGLKATGIMLIVDLLSKGVGAVLGPFGKMLSDIMSAFQFALQPLFMRFRFLVLPFLQVMFPLFVDLIEYIWKEYIGPFVMVSIPTIQKFVQWLISIGKTFFEDPAKGWEKLKTDVMAFWDAELQPLVSAFLTWAAGEGWNMAMAAWDRWVMWVQGTLYPAMGRWVNQLWEWFLEKYPRWWYDWEKWVIGTVYPWMGKVVSQAWDGFTTAAGVVWDAAAAWVTTDLPKLLGRVWKAIKDGLFGVWNWVNEETGLGDLLGTKKVTKPSIMGTSSVAIAKTVGRLKKKRDAGTLTPGDISTIMALRESGIKGLRGGGVVEGSPGGQLVVVGEGGTTEGVIPFGRDIPREDAIRMMQAATMAASMAGGGGAAAGGDQKMMGLFQAMLEHLAMIADNTESSDWINDPDFDTSKRRGPWQT